MVAISRQIGDAFVTISPDTAGFRALMDAKVKEALATIKPEVPVKLSIDRNSLGQFLSAAQKAANIRANVNMDQAFGAITSLKARMEVLAKTLSTMRLNVSDDPATLATIASTQLKVAALAKLLGGLKIGVNDSALPSAEAAVLRLEAAAQKLKVPINMGVALDARPTIGAIAGLQAKAKTLAATLTDMRINAKDIGAQAAIAKLQVQLGTLTSKISNIKIGIDVQGFAAAEQQLLALEATMEKVGPAAVVGDTALGVFTRSANGMGGVLGVLGGRVKLFGGALQGLLPEALASVAVWHIIADVIIELGAVLIPATLAVIAFGVAGSDAAKQIQARMQAAHTVLDATGLSASKTATNMEALHKAVQPQVYQLFGDALTIVNSRTGNFGTIAKGTGVVLDQLAARFTFAVTQGKGMSTFMQHAVTDVAKLGDILGNLGGVFGNIFKVIPGFATGLLSIADGFTKVLETISRVTEPATKVILWMHGIILYSGLAVTAVLAFVGGIANLARSFITFAAGGVLAGINAIKTFSLMLASGALNVLRFAGALLTGSAAETAFGAASIALLTNPITWIVAGVVLVGAWAYALHNASSATKDFTSNLDKTIQAATLTQVIPTIMSAQAAVSDKLAAAQTKLAATTEYTTYASGHAGSAIKGVSQAYQAQQAIVDQLKSKQSDLGTEYNLVSGRVGDLSKQLGGNTQALGALNAAGITTAQITDTNNQHWAQALIQINSTISAYQQMGTQSGQLGNDLDVLGRTVTDQYQAIQKLNQAWGTFITDVTGTQTAFDTVALGVANLDQNFAKAGGTGSTLTNRLGQLKLVGTLTGATIDGLSQASLDLNQAFATQVTNTDKLYASWRTAGLANSQFVQGVKDSIVPLVKYAAGSQEATAQLVALAQEAGYQGPNSMSALVKWLGNTKGATQNLKDITNQATVQEALLTGAMQAQGSYIASTLLGDINQAVLKYNGVSKAVTAYGVALAQSGKGSDTANKAMVAAINAIVKSEVALGDTSTQAGAIVAKVFGLSMPASMKLVQAAWDKVTKTSSTSAQSIQQDFTKQQVSAKNAQTMMDTYTKSVLANGTGTANSKKYRDQLVADMISSGVNSTTAKNDVATYTSAIANNASTSQAVRSARLNLINDILQASANSRQGKTDLANLTTEVARHGTTSSTYRNDRLNLIADLQATGKNSATATGLVDGLITSIKQIPTSWNTSVSVNGKGTWSIAQQAAFANPSGKGGTSIFAGGAAAGWRVPGFGGGDHIPILVEPGETIVPKHLTPAVAPLMKAYGVPGFSSGGLPGFALGGLPGLGSWNHSEIQMQVNADVSSVETAMVNALNSAVRAAQVAAAKAAAGGGTPGSVTSGVNQWRGLVLQALAMEGLSASLVNNVLYQMQTESSGNQAAINRTDSNAAAGTPSKGLMQVIGPTFAAYHWPGTSSNIYDPLANIAAALNYAAHVYGPNLANQYGGIGSGHGYASGGRIADRGTTLKPGWNPPLYNATGRDEPLVPGGNGSDLNQKFDQLIALTSRHIELTRRLISTTASVPAGVGHSLGGALNGAASQASFNQRYRRGGA